MDRNHAMEALGDKVEMGVNDLLTMLNRAHDLAVLVPGASPAVELGRVGNYLAFALPKVQYLVSLHESVAEHEIMALDEEQEADEQQINAVCKAKMHVQHRGSSVSETTRKVETILSVTESMWKSIFFFAHEKVNLQERISALERELEELKTCVE